MRYAASEKLEIIRTVETSHLPVRRTLDKIGIPKTTFYAWLDRYAAGGFEALEDRKPRPRRIWNRILDEIRDKVIERALDEPELSPREVAVAFTDAEKTFVSEASVYRILKAEGLVTSPAFIVMKAADRFANPTTAILQASGLEHTNPDRQPRLLSDNGPSYVANDLSDWLEVQGMRHTRGKPYHPMTQGKIERWHLSLKSRILLENYYLPGDLERAIDDFVQHYNHRRYHESLDNLTPADVYFGRGDRIRKRREEIKRRTIEQRRQQHFNAAA